METSSIFVVRASVKVLSKINPMIVNWTATKINCDSTYVRSHPLPSYSFEASECAALPIEPGRMCL